MLTINKVFGILCLLCLCWNREYPGSVQNKSLSSSFKWFPNILFLAKLKGRPFWSGQAKIYPLNYFLHVGVMLTIIKVLSSYSYSACGNKEHPGNFQNESASSPFSWVSRYVLFLAKVKVKRKPFWRVQEGGPHCEITNLLSEGMKNISFCKIWNNPAPPLSFIRPSYK